MFYFSIYAFTIVMKFGFKDAPPTKNPSMSGFAIKFLQLSVVTDPKKY